MPQTVFLSLDRSAQNSGVDWNLQSTAGGSVRPISYQWKPYQSGSFYTARPSSPAGVKFDWTTNNTHFLGEYSDQPNQYSSNRIDKIETFLETSGGNLYIPFYSKDGRELEATKTSRARLDITHDEWCDRREIPNALKNDSTVFTQLASWATSSTAVIAPNETKYGQCIGIPQTNVAPTSLFGTAPDNGYSLQADMELVEGNAPYYAVSAPNITFKDSIGLVPHTNYKHAEKAGAIFIFGFTQNGDRGNYPNVFYDTYFSVNTTSGKGQQLMVEDIIHGNQGQGLDTADYSFCNFGYSMELTPDGSLLAAGAPFLWNNTEEPGYYDEISDDLAGPSQTNIPNTTEPYGKANCPQGYAQVWQRSSTTTVLNDIPSGTSLWSQKGNTIFCPASAGSNYNARFGASISISPDGQWLAVGAPMYENSFDIQTGAVFIYLYNNSTQDWVLKNTITRTSPLYGEDRFGSMVKLAQPVSGELILHVNSDRLWDRTKTASHSQTNKSPQGSGRLASYYIDTNGDETPINRFSTTVEEPSFYSSFSRNGKYSAVVVADRNTGDIHKLHNNLGADDSFFNGYGHKIRVYEESGIQYRDQVISGQSKTIGDDIDLHHLNLTLPQKGPKEEVCQWRNFHWGRAGGHKDNKIWISDDGKHLAVGIMTMLGDGNSITGSFVHGVANSTLDNAFKWGSSNQYRYSGGSEFVLFFDLNESTNKWEQRVDISNDEYENDLLSFISYTYNSSAGYGRGQDGSVASLNPWKGWYGSMTQPRTNIQRMVKYGNDNFITGSPDYYKLTDKPVQSKDV